MAEKANEKEHGSGWWIWLALLALPVFYVLSVGPAAVIANKTGRGMAVMDGVYAPVTWLHDHTPLKKPLEAYVELWMRGVGDSP